MKSNNPIKAVLFDLDGTLLDTALDLGGAANILLSRDNLPLLNDQIIHQTASQGSLALIKAGYGNKLTDEQYKNLREEFLDNYTKHINDQTRYFDSVNVLLDTLDANNIIWGIVTNKPTLYTQQLLTHYPRLANCAVVICGDTLQVSKPDPAPLLLAAKKLAIPPRNIAYVGDARTDMESANSAGMLSIAANYGYIPIDDPTSQWGGDHQIDQAKDLFSLLSLQ